MSVFIIRLTMLYVHHCNFFKITRQNSESNFDIFTPYFKSLSSNYEYLLNNEIKPIKSSPDCLKNEGICMKNVNTYSPR